MVDKLVRGVIDEKVFVVDDGLVLVNETNMTDKQLLEYLDKCSEDAEIT